MSGGIRGAYGYGVGGEAHVPAVEDPAPDWQSLITDIHALRQEYVLDHLLRPVVFSLAAGGTQVIDSDRRDVSLMSVTVTAGTLDVWIGERGGVPFGSTPHARFAITGAPQHLPLPPGPVQVTLASGESTAGVTGCVIFSTA